MILKESLETIKDSRIDRCKKHSLVDILMIVFFGLLCGYISIESIHLYAELSINVLKKYLVLANGIPSADTILRVLAKIDTEQLGKVFIEYARSVFENRIKDGDVVAFDGKTECGSKYSPVAENGTEHKAVHMVSAWASRLGICFGQIKTEEKSNEITAIPELLDLLDLKGVIVTIDAMGCQKKIAGKITEKKSDYVFSLKGNQEKIHDDVKEFFTGHQLDEKYCERYKIQKYESELEIAHGRIEKRTGFLCTNIKLLEGKDEWSNLKAVGMVECHRIEKRKRIVRNEIFHHTIDRCRQSLRGDEFSLGHRKWLALGTGCSFWRRYIPTAERQFSCKYEYAQKTCHKHIETD